MNRHHRRAERAACRSGPVRVPRRPIPQQATQKEVDELKAAYDLLRGFVEERKDDLKKIPPTAVASMVLDFACMLLAGAHLEGDTINWDGINRAMHQSFVDHLNHLRKTR